MWADGRGPSRALGALLLSALCYVSAFFIMAKLQRGRSEPEKAVRVSGNMSDTSEDEGPEEVAFDVSRSAAQKMAEEVLQAARREKDLLKERRQKRQQFFQEQKKKRLLSDTLLKEFDTVPKRQKRCSDIEDNGKEEENEDEKQPETKRRKKKKAIRSLQGNCSVMRLKDEDADASVQSAVNFIQERLYGSQTCRTTNVELMSLKRKRGVKKGAAVQFVKKKWATELKTKAEKSNKRFLHNFKLVTS